MVHISLSVCPTVPCVDKVRCTGVYRSIQAVCTYLIGDQYEWYISMPHVSCVGVFGMTCYVPFRQLVRTDKANHMCQYIGTYHTDGRLVHWYGLVRRTMLCSFISFKFIFHVFFCFSLQIFTLFF